MTHIAATYLSMVVGPALALCLLYWMVGKASRIIESHQGRRTISRRLNNAGRK